VAVESATAGRLLSSGAPQKPLSAKAREMSKDYADLTASRAAAAVERNK
jgi:hypothetical protein